MCRLLRQRQRQSQRKSQRRQRMLRRRLAEEEVVEEEEEESLLLWVRRCKLSYSSQVTLKPFRVQWRLSVPGFRIRQRQSQCGQRTNIQY